ncbi:2-hydroxy-3-oxopropionate reductase [Oscillospiraceae bacterium MB08-C2-2]|nr:2-hydroxy-3-oxopropionate reductase [Oscillospiraceae bacterium MB08-C2-2]
MNIGFIGLGIMGKPMSKNLIKAGYSLTVFDIYAPSVEDVVAAGAKAASSVKELAASSDLVITMLPNSPQVKAIVLGEGGVLEGAHAGMTLIDMSSISPIASKEVAAALKEKGVDMLDAPVSGGEPKAVDGTLSIMVGGDAAVFEKFRDLLLKMGSSAVLCGDIGAGNTTKLANQIVVALNIAAVAEAFTLGNKAGVDPQLIYNAIRGGLAGSTVMDAKGPMMIEHNFKPGFKIDLHHKDLANALDTARELDAYLPLTSQAFEILKVLRNEGMGQNDHSGILAYYEKLSHTTLGE